MGSDSPWMQELCHLDPLLKQPFDLYGSSASRRTQVWALARLLGFETQMDRRSLSECTCQLLWPMVEQLAETLSARRVHVPTRARLLATGTLNDERAPIHVRLEAHLVWAALLDLGWSDRPLPVEQRPTALSACDAARNLYVAQMTTRVERMLRHLERSGLLDDAV